MKVAEDAPVCEKSDNIKINSIIRVLYLIIQLTAVCDYECFSLSMNYYISFIQYEFIAFFTESLLFWINNLLIKNPIRLYYFRHKDLELFKSNNSTLGSMDKFSISLAFLLLISSPLFVNYEDDSTKLENNVNMDRIDLSTDRLAF